VPAGGVGQSSSLPRAERGGVIRRDHPEGAATIADYLKQLEADFQIVETTARALAALTGPSYRKPYPQNLGFAMTYSARPETA
jgi:hypothetical protein